MTQLSEGAQLAASAKPAAGLPRWLEVSLAVCGLIVLAPLLLLIGLGVRVTSPGPALFRQQRVGRGGRAFELLKFRSMSHRPAVGSDAEVTARADARVTGFGRVLRATKLDELPELINVVRGEMSLVGPRPEVLRYVDRQDERWQRVLQQRPGLTCRTTLLLRNEESLLSLGAAHTERSTEVFYTRFLLPFKLDRTIEEFRVRSATADLATLARTVWSILARGRSPSEQRLLTEILARGRSPSEQRLLTEILEHGRVQSGD